MIAGHQVKNHHIEQILPFFVLANRIFPIAFSSVAIASAPHPSLGGEAMGNDETRGNPLCVGSRIGVCYSSAYFKSRISCEVNTLRKKTA